MRSVRKRPGRIALLNAAALLWRDALSGASLRLPARAALAAALVVLIGLGLAKGDAQIQSTKRADPHPFYAFRDMITYVEAHDPAPIVFNASWSDFQHMVYWATTTRFVAGLDGHFLLYGDPQRFRTWYTIINGRTASRSDNARVIRATFDARWAVIPRGYPAANVLLHDPDARLVMERPEGLLFELQPGP